MTTTEEGQIRLKIEQFSRFASTAGQPITSAPVFVQKLPWTIKAEWKPAGASGNINFSVQCGVKNTGWSCSASAVLRVVAQKEGMEHWTEHWKMSLNEQLYNAQQKSQCHVYSVTDLKTPDYGFYDSENDTIILEADIKVDTPQGLSIPLSERMLYLLSSQKDADVHFLVGSEDGRKEKFGANKMIITTVSDVFERMFAFDATNGVAGRVIEVPDVEPGPFRVMLNFIYAEELDGLKQDNLIAVLYAAKKYNIVGLINACLNCALNANGIFTLLNQARYYEEKKLIDRCLDFIDKNVKVVFETSEFLQIDQALLCELFARDTLALSRQGGEITIWNAAIRWVQAQYRKREMEYTSLNRREVLGQAFFNIRFPLVDKQNFARIIAGILTKDEILGVCMYHLDPYHSHELYPLNFSANCRA